MKAKRTKLTRYVKNLNIQIGSVKGIKFAAKTATSPISLGITAGFLGAAAIKKGLNEKPSKRLGRSYDRKGISLL